MEQTVTVAVVLKGSQHQYWKSVTAGTAQAERDLQLQGTRVRLIRRAPLRDDGHEEQVRILENILQQGVQGLILAPCSPDALAAPVEAAARMGVPTVVIDDSRGWRRIHLPARSLREGSDAKRRGRWSR